MTDKEVLIKVQGVSKKFCRNLKRSLFYGFTDILRSMFGIIPPTGLRKDEFWAVREVSFEVRRGDCLGLIGHNGAGKSTLLKMLNGLIRPDSGRIEMYGKIGALIELGAGFNPLLTGRENVYTNGAVLGFSKGEIDERFDAIVAFAELEEFIDMPVQNYSSGMKVRLGFAVASQMEPDILLIDEVLAVGDLGFVLKCFNRIDQILKNTAIILVSHNMPQVARMSNNLILMDGGKIFFNGSEIGDGINQYYSRFTSVNSNMIKHSDSVELEQVWIERADGKKEYIKENLIVPYGTGITIFIKLRAIRRVLCPKIQIAFYDKEQRNFCEVMNFPQGDLVQDIQPNSSTIFIAQFDSIPFAHGIFSVTIVISEMADGVRKNLLRTQSAVYFQVKGLHHGWAPVQFLANWRIEPV